MEKFELIDTQGGKLDFLITKELMRFMVILHCGVVSIVQDSLLFLNTATLFTPLPSPPRIKKMIFCCISNSYIKWDLSPSTVTGIARFLLTIFQFKVLVFNRNFKGWDLLYFAYLRNQWYEQWSKFHGIHFWNHKLLQVLTLCCIQANRNASVKWEKMLIEHAF